MERFPKDPAFFSLNSEPSASHVSSINIRLYFSNKIKSGVISKLPKNQSHYVKNVIRLKAGQQFSVFNSDGEWKALILLHTKDYTEFKVLEKLRHQEEQQEIYLAFSPIKKIAQDIMLQKTTELGVKKFFPIFELIVNKW